jgi:hypothetical protein
MNAWVVYLLEEFPDYQIKVLRLVVVVVVVDPKVRL